MLDKPLGCSYRIRSSAGLEPISGVGGKVFQNAGEQIEFEPRLSSSVSGGCSLGLEVNVADHSMKLSEAGCLRVLRDTRQRLARNMKCGQHLLPPAEF